MLDHKLFLDDHYNSKGFLDLCKSLRTTTKEQKEIVLKIKFQEIKKEKQGKFC